VSKVGAEVIVAGHICLDIIPAMHLKKTGMGAIMVPGKLVEIGQAVISTGGAVSNTGLALHRLGNRVKLMGKIGHDEFGDMILKVIQKQGESLINGMITAEGEQSSYSIVISPPQVDRIFLHCTGANDTFAAADLQVSELAGCRLFHLGYPPLMRRLFERDGEELTRLLRTVKQRGITTSLDLAKPDPDSDAGRADWRTILVKSLPYVDVFMPSFEEILFMLHRDKYEQFLQESSTGDLLQFADGALLSEIAEELLGMGAAIVGLKLGEHGLYIRTSASSNRLHAMGLCAPEAENWVNRELLSPCFMAESIGTTGAGDSTIAGFLSGLLRGLSIEAALESAVAVGAYNVEQADAVSGIPSWEEARQRIAAGWAKREISIKLLGWKSIEEGLWQGPDREDYNEVSK
jgi:sugar/nucleoside kinase (ribokinase family)